MKHIDLTFSIVFLAVYGVMLFSLVELRAACKQCQSQQPTTDDDFEITELPPAPEEVNLKNAKFVRFDKSDIRKEKAAHSRDPVPEPPEPIEGPPGPTGPVGPTGPTGTVTFPDKLVIEMSGDNTGPTTINLTQQQLTTISNNVIQQIQPQLNAILAKLQEMQTARFTVHNLDRQGNLIGSPASVSPFGGQLNLQYYLDPTKQLPRIQ